MQAQFPRDCCRCGSHDRRGDSGEQGCHGSRHVAKAARKFAFTREDKLDQYFLDLVHVEEGSVGDPPSTAPGTLEGLTLNIVGKGQSQRKRLLEPYRDVLVELAELYHVAQHKVLDCLLMVLRATTRGVRVTHSRDAE